VGKRSKGRALLLQALYASRLSGRNLTDCLEDQLARRDSADETARFARELGRKLVGHGPAAERSLGPLLANWDLARVGLLERLILTLAVVELRESPEVPPRVVINEACELARQFCTEEAVKFVNGVLDRAAHELEPGAGPPADADPGADRP
jgi:N utilization substance protein B